MNIKRMLSLLLALSLCLCSACSDASDNIASSSSQPITEIQTSPAQDELSLAYSSTDTLDPYTAITRFNKELCTLLYDTLISVKDDYTAEYRLAERVERVENKFTITIRSAVFSDGTAVTAEDVVYSIGKARDSETKYKTQLDGISHYSAIGSRTLEITISNSDPYFINLLDFPIIKKDSDQRKNEDGKFLPPIGSGRYIFTDGALTANESYVGGQMNVKTIELVDTPDNEAFEHNLEMGTIGYSFSDLSDNIPLKMTGQSQAVQLSNLVYLGINFKNTFLSDPQFRQAINLAISRDKIVSDCYFDYAEAAAGPFPSAWEEVSGLQTISATENSKRAVAILSEMGYNSKDGDGYLLDAGGNRITLTLLCSLDNSARISAAQMIKSNLAAIGIFVEIRTVNRTAYLSDLGNLYFDLYMGEIKLKSNLDISALVTEKSGACFGYVKTKTDKKDNTSSISDDTVSDDEADTDAGQPVSEETDGAQSSAYITVSAFDMVESMYKGEATIADVTAAFNAELPVIPLLYRKGQVAYYSSIKTGPTPSVGDLFYGIESITFN